jgi:hypothetical protein
MSLEIERKKLNLDGRKEGNKKKKNICCCLWDTSCIDTRMYLEKNVEKPERKVE